MAAACIYDLASFAFNGVDFIVRIASRISFRAIPVSGKEIFKDFNNASIYLADSGGRS